ncbi:MAG: sodium:proton antiporter [Thiohalocapsa sp.]|nr:sodium:proton antiporter [Thiohalocapsa sp.]
MSAFLFAAAVLVLVMVSIGLARLLRGAQPLDWVMAAQLLGTAGIAALLLAGTAASTPGAVDLALLLALLAAFATMAFAANHRTGAARSPETAAQAGAAEADNVRRPASPSPGGSADGSPEQ